MATAASWTPISATSGNHKRLLHTLCAAAFFLPRDDFKCALLRSAHHQRNNYFIFRVCRGLRTAPNAIFTGGVVTANGICSAAFCESAALRGTNPLRHRCAMPPPPKGGGFALLTARWQKAPPGGAVAQRLRGYKWRSEKSVKAIAPTGAALAFLCFDFFFRIVKGV